MMLSLTLRCYDCQETFHYERDSGSGRVPDLCADCAYRRMQRYRRIHPDHAQAIHRTPRVCVTEGCERRVIVGSAGPMPSRCPECYRRYNRDRLRAWREKQRAKSVQPVASDTTSDSAG